MPPGPKLKKGVQWAQNEQESRAQIQNQDGVLVFLVIAAVWTVGIFAAVGIGIYAWL